MSYILITGSEGLIGKNLCSVLERLGEPIKRFDIKFPQNHNDFGDVLNLNCLQQRLKDCIGIVHLAAVSRVVWGEENPQHCWQTNVIGTKNVITAAKNSYLKPWIVYASSREVYGQQQNLPVEIDAKLLPMNTYAKSKVVAEEEILEARKSHLLTAVVRYSSVYGNIDDYETRVIPAFCRQAILGKQLRVDGFNNTLDFTHVNDVVDGTVKIVGKLGRGNVLPPLHLTTGIPTTLEKLAKFVCSLTGRNSEYIEAPSRSYDVAKFWGETARTAKLLDWKAKVSVEDGIGNFICQLKSLLEKK